MTLYRIGRCTADGHTDERCLNCGGRDVSLDLILPLMEVMGELSPWLTKSDKWGEALRIIDILQEWEVTVDYEAARRLYLGVTGATYPTIEAFVQAMVDAALGDET